jgi:hypothetical protein
MPPSHIRISINVFGLWWVDEILASGFMYTAHLTANAKVATFLGSIPAFFFTVEPEGGRLSSVE